MPLITLDDFVLQPRKWHGAYGVWCGENFELETPFTPFSQILTSPEFGLDGGRLVTFTFSADFAGPCGYLFGVERLDDPKLRRAGRGVVHSRLFNEVVGTRRLSLAFRALKTGRYRLFLALSHRAPETSPIAIGRPALLVQALGQGRISNAPVAALQPLGAKVDDVSMPQWGALKRYLHRRCRDSRGFNNIVSAIEMRLGCEEVVSLPQYMAICPTGQCNALCAFCSVTSNRTGIIKKQLPFDRLDEFLAPTSKTIQLYGIEGNGEPTLYARFPELVERMTRNDDKAYLITNGSRLQPKDVPLLMALESINFSLNAATAETHTQVMKLKNFDEITTIIRSLSQERGLPGPVSAPTPQLYTSFVVTNQNIHEVQDFIRFAEYDLGVDIIMVRPLSELGNDIGATEDLREIVPFESDIKDMVDAVADYMADTPRRADIRIAPETFASFRPDPVGRLQMPAGFEGRLLAPRRRAWHLLHPDGRIDWRVNEAKILIPATEGPVLRTDAIDIAPGHELIFKAAMVVAGGAVTLSVVDGNDRVVGSTLVTDTGGYPVDVTIALQPGDAATLALVVAGMGVPATADIDFERLRTPATYVSAGFRIPTAHRWELCVAEATVDWSENSVTLNSSRGGGPYLLKSYGIPCGRGQLIEIPIDIDVRKGAVSVGVLNESSAKFLESMEFASGRSLASIVFQTGDNDNVRLLVFAEPGREVEATIHWPGQEARSADADAPREAIALPEPTQWRKCVEGVVDKHPDFLSVSWHGKGNPYLARSNKFWCAPNQRIELPLTLRVNEGKVSIGVLDSSETTWLTRRVFGQGSHNTTLDFQTGTDARVSAVISPIDGFPAELELELTGSANSGDARMITIAHRVPERIEAALLREGSARITALDGSLAERELELVGETFGVGGRSAASLDSAPKRGAAAPPRDELGGTFATALSTASPEEPADADADPEPAAEPGPVADLPSASWPKPPPQPSLPRRLGRAFTRKTRYSCQKPWTDLHNFTVDGRMDVCCIATGPSQMRYQLGNLNQHTFQQIWNGPTAREFRRTVNSDKPLPPCARCPMLHAYQGLWFDPRYTREYVENKIIEITKSTRIGRHIAHLAARLSMHLFRGF